ncbi:MAG TPA: hypothetical protein VJK30_02615 [Coxiellaceae bacterium]|nr:MAG: hypothetical protein A3E81_02615 [Gammaproteobacteria bacterium RIFCSPHIGHO2_12_FULL_36_30]HLB56207.1 hypothetical protein [Coxiellaceae bacterium]
MKRSVTTFFQNTTPTLSEQIRKAINAGNYEVAHDLSKQLSNLPGAHDLAEFLGIAHKNNENPNVRTIVATLKSGRDTIANQLRIRMMMFDNKSSRQENVTATATSTPVKAPPYL